MNWKIILIGLLVVSFLWRGVNIFQSNLEDVFYAQITQPLENIYLVQIPQKPEKPHLEIAATSAISVKIFENGRRKMIFKQNINQVLPIASLTKLMTAVIVLEDSINYDFAKIITVSKTAVSQAEDFGNLKIEDKLSVKDLLHILLIESSNDAAYALAEEIGIEQFIEKMNQRAQVLNLSNTYFINPTGLDPERAEVPTNYSTAENLAQLSQYILNNHPLIFEISSKMSYEVLDGWGQFHHLAINKNNGFLGEIKNFVGGKTGFTEKAGGCMILVLKNQCSHLINVILGTKSADERQTEMQKLIDWINNQ